MATPTLEPVLSLVIDAHAVKGSTVLVGVTGGVAVGKSTFSIRLATLLSEDTGLDVAVIATDGFLLPNATLAGNGLSDRKGFPESYDAAAITHFLHEVRDGRPTTVPIYDHLTYDIVEGMIDVPPIDVLIFEGVNALQFHNELDLSIYLHADEPIMREWFVQRTTSFRDAARTEYSPFFDPWTEVPEEIFLSMVIGAWEGVNLPNLVHHIEPTRTLAHVVIEWEADHEIRTITLQEST